MPDGGVGLMLFHMNMVQDNCINVFVKGFLFRIITGILMIGYSK
jgi:hypothetical protein